MRLLGTVGVVGWAIASTASAMSLEAQQALARAAVFAPTTPNADAATVSATPFADAAGGAPVWLAQTARAGSRPGETLVLSTVSQQAAAGAVLGAPSADTLQQTSYDLAYTRAWPSAFSLAVGKYGLDLSPRAGVGTGGSGQSAGAGVTARFGKNLGNKLAERLGVRDASGFGGQGRWYIFAASDSTAVGLNLLHKDGDWRRAGITQDATSALVGDTQAGLGWRKGPMQASMGYIHRDVKIRQGATEGLMGASDRSDNLVALSFTIKPN